MLNFIKRGFSLLLAVVLVSGLLQINVYAEETESAETKVYSGATLEDEFAEDRVLVVLNNETSLAVDQYEAATFSGINCSSVKSLTQAKETTVQEKLNSISVELNELAANMNTIDVDETASIMEIAATDEELSSYKQILCIELEEFGKDKVLEAIAVLEKQENVIYAGPDYVVSACSTTANDTYYSQQWALDMINLPEAWDVTTGSSSVTVAVVDSGIDGDHPDLAGRINTSLCRDFTSGSAVAVGVPTDDRGHGTFIAGIIGAIGDNNEGVTGTCWDVTLVSLKVFNAWGTGFSSYVAAAVDFAEQNNIPIINYSGGSYGEPEDNALYTAISYYSGLFVCASGNESLNIDENLYYPANHELSNIISVGASNINDEMCTFTNYGKRNVDIFAPGYNIYSTTSTGGYDMDYGTSVATPYVTGVAALLLSKDPGLTVAELKQSILNNVDVVYDSEGNNVYGAYCTSGGRLNAYKALTNIAHLQHTYTYTNQGIYDGHKCTCSECSYTYTENHTWVSVLSMYQCSKCRVKSSFVPATPSSINENDAEGCCE